MAGNVDDLMVFRRAYAVSLELHRASGACGAAWRDRQPGAAILEIGVCSADGGCGAVAPFAPGVRALSGDGAGLGGRDAAVVSLRRGPRLRAIRAGRGMA